MLSFPFLTVTTAAGCTPGHKKAQKADLHLQTSHYSGCGPFCRPADCMSNNYLYWGSR